MTKKRAGVPFRKRRLIVYIAVAALITITLFLVFRASQLDKEIAALRSQGLPTNVTELNLWYSIPTDVADTTELWTAATHAVATAGIDQQAAAIPVVGLGPVPIPAPGNEWGELDLSRTFLLERDTAIQLIMRAADAGGMARYPVDFTVGTGDVLSAPQELRVIARLLKLSAHVHAHDGQDSDGLQDVKAIFSVSDSLRGEPLLLSQLVRIAIHAVGCELTAELLPYCKWTGEELEQLQIAIGRARFREEMLTAFHGERACCLSAFETAPGILLRDANKLKAIELFGESTMGLDASWLELTKRNQKIDSELKSMNGSIISRMKYGVLIQSFPALQVTMNSGPRAEARQNCAIVTLAACRYRLQHGTLPQSLADLHNLIPGDASEISLRLRDPFDGQPLRFKSENSQLVIYSVGDNKADDGGDIANEKPLEGDLGYSIADQG